ncbi:MAG TPA: NAD-dependent deacylase [bacterium]|nr:NAD-dependent deacylase [bacterium]HPN43604.1 NAD-dependent deacylase [bacterium]
MNNLFSDTTIKKLATAKRIGVLTGAGISAESGIPTFRGQDGLWQQLKPEELASVDGFMKNPRLVWQWYEYRREIIQHVKPNTGHFILADMEKCYPVFSLSTQNVDGLHFRAGSKNVLELHGNILVNRCHTCNKYIADVHFQNGSTPPRCDCGGLIRPGVVWFGETLPEEVLERSFTLACEADVYLSIGTSAQVYPAAMLPREAQQHGAYIIEINPERTPLSTAVDEFIPGKSGEVLPVLWNLVKPFVKV